MTQPKAASGMRVVIVKDGPYRVTGGVPLSKQTIGVNAADESVAWVEGADCTPGGAYMLCRCGGSSTKPFCDASHLKNGFDGAETAGREPYRVRAQEIDGPAVVLTDAESLCAFARFCDRDGTVWKSVSDAISQERRDAFAAQVGQCPSGRLAAWGKAAGEPIEPEFPASIVLVEDPAQEASGPLWVRGAIEIIGSDGAAYEIRNRVTLCRCGESKNKPFCDGTHASIHFRAN
jgi:CDGSH-type Zn-finger protein